MPQEHYPNFSSAEEMRKSLLAGTAMERVKELDSQLEDAVVKAVSSQTHQGEHTRDCRVITGALMG